MKRKIELVLVLVLPVTLFGFFGQAKALEPGYPTKPVEMLLGLAPGGGTDLSVRVLAEVSRKYSGQEMLVTNKPGGGGRVATTMVARAKPDGYTLGAITNAPIVLYPHLEKLSYKPFDDFTFIIQYGVMDYVFAALTDSPFKTLRDMIEFARKNPNKLTVGTVGPGTTNHVAMEAIANMEGIKVNLVPYNSAGQTVTALLGKHVMIAGTGTSGVSQHVAAKTVRILAVMGDKRAPAHPDVPTLRELGYSDLVFRSQYVMIGPKNMKNDLVQKVTQYLRKGLESPTYVKAVQDLELWEKNLLAGDELKAELLKYYNAYGEIFKKLKMRTDNK